MALIDAWRTQSPLGGVLDNAYLGPHYAAFTAELATLDAWRTSTTGVAPYTNNAPVSAAGRLISGFAAGSWSDDYYHRVHVTPRQLDLGNVVSTQSTQVSVWNAWLEPRTLSAISGLAEGILVSGQSAPPLLYPPLLERTYQVSVTPDGAPVLDTSVAWAFDNGEAPALRITANRVVAWTFVPDWSEGVTERLSWATDILQSESLVEQRRALRVAPRREFEAQIVVEGRERQMLDLALFGWGARIWVMPIWHEIQRLATGVSAGSLSIACDTAGLEFYAGGVALLRGESAFASEAVEIESVSPAGLVLKRPLSLDWPATTRLYPAGTAQLIEAPTLTRLTDTAALAGVAFRALEPSDASPSAPVTLYRSRPVLEARPDESDDLTATYARLLGELDNGTATPLVVDVAGRALPVMSQRWVGLGRAERATYRALLYYLAGRQGAVWVPTHADDLTLVALVGSIATTIDVGHVGYTRFAKANSARRDIRIELHDGTVFHRRITGSTELSADTERLAIDAALGRIVTPGDVGRISWMTLCRLDSDTVEIQHLTDSEGVAQSALVFRGVRDDDL